MEALSSSKKPSKFALSMTPFSKPEIKKSEGEQIWWFFMGHS
jgi:hypothetical protein